MMKWLKRFSVGTKLNNVEDASNSKIIADSENEIILDLADPDLIANFKKLSPSLKSKQPTCPLKTGGLLLLDSDDIQSVFTNKIFSNQPSRFSALAPKNKDKYTAAAVAANIPPFLDSERHIEVRRWLSRTFFERLKGFEPEIHRISKEQIVQTNNNHQYLLVEELARGFVTETMMKFVGISVPKGNIKSYTSALFKLFAPAKNAEVYQQTNEALQNAREGLLEALIERRKDKAPCLLTIMDQTPAEMHEGPDHKDLMIVDNALLILADGIENVEAAIAQVIMKWFEMDQEVPTISPDFVHDCIRNDTPGQTIPRIASEDMVINGKKIGAGTPVFLSLASANSESKTEVDFSFGLGRHRCIGERLAISMITIFCNDLIKTNPKIDHSSLTYAPMFGHKWPREVKITLNKPH